METILEPEKSKERLAVLEKMEVLEREGRFDEDIEQDPPTKPLLPEDIKYLNDSLWAKIKRKIAFSSAYAFVRKLKRKNQFFINPTVNAEILSSVKGAVVTANHFSPFDSFVMQIVFDESKRKGKMYRVIREGNYTSFPGFYGFLMRNCDTLPLSSNMATMKKFLRATETALKRDDCILVYPEQSMWWNYRKPKPLKPGAFDIAVKNGVPVVPCFITMDDSEFYDSDGFKVQIYTPYLGAPIYPDKSLSRKEACQKLMEEVYAFNKEVYEKHYGIPLTYLT